MSEPWTQQSVIDAIRRWAEQHGDVPNSRDWDPWSLRGRDNETRLKRFDDGEFPTYIVVVKAFGSFRSAFEAAGFERSGPNDRKPMWTREAKRSGADHIHNV